MDRRRDPALEDRLAVRWPDQQWETKEAKEWGEGTKIWRVKFKKERTGGIKLLPLL